MVAENNKKKICIAIHGLAHAGAERVAVSWANHLVSRGHQVFFAVYAHTKDSYDLDRRVQVHPIADTPEGFYQMPKAKQLLSIRKLMRRERPELLISFLPKMQITMMLATLGMKLKRIETVRNNPWIDQDIGKRRFLWDLCFRRSDAIIVQTKEQALYFPERLQKKVVVISNPISSEFSKHQKVYTDRGVHRFVAVARINAQKNYPLMVGAFAQVARANPDCTLDIYGAGTPDNIARLQAQIDRLGMTDNIRLCGWQRDIAELLPAYDAFLMSSDYEGMPNALAEAMAMGLVCLSTDCKTGPKDMIDSGENGFLAATGDVDSFADGIGAITQMSGRQCAEMGAAARASILALCNEQKTLARLGQLIEAEL